MKRNLYGDVMLALMGIYVLLLVIGTLIGIVFFIEHYNTIKTLGQH